MLAFQPAQDNKPCKVEVKPDVRNTVCLDLLGVVQGYDDIAKEIVDPDAQKVSSNKTVCRRVLFVDVRVAPGCSRYSHCVLQPVYSKSRLLQD